MKQYDILHSPHRLDLIAAVNEAFKTGWEAHGPLVIAYPPVKIGQSTSMDYLQPLIRETRYTDEFPSLAPSEA